MSPSNTLSIALRVVRQLVRDRRTIVIILVIPLVIMTLLRYSFPGESSLLNSAYPPLLATMGLLFSFMLTGISFLRERSQGTMERMMASPVSRVDMVVGYLLGFFILALGADTDPSGGSFHYLRTRCTSCPRVSMADLHISDYSGYRRSQFRYIYLRVCP